MQAKTPPGPVETVTQMSRTTQEKGRRGGRRTEPLGAWGGGVLGLDGRRTEIRRRGGAPLDQEQVYRASETSGEVAGRPRHPRLFWLRHEGEITVGGELLLASRRGRGTKNLGQNAVTRPQQRGSKDRLGGTVQIREAGKGRGGIQNWGPQNVGIVKRSKEQDHHPLDKVENRPAEKWGDGGILRRSTPKVGGKAKCSPKARSPENQNS